jgi:trans-2,3-dihydro-3-hydroxyanthranilate isomerase
LPFAGHPTLGTAFVVAKSKPKQTEIGLRMKVGVIPVSIKRKGEQTYLEMRQKDPLFGTEVPDRRRLSEAIGLDASDLDSRYHPQAVSTGVPFLITPLASHSALERLTPNWKLLTPIVEESGAHFPYYVVTGEKDLEARMRTPDFEDPATGSAAGCAAAYLVRYGICKPDSKFSIRQGGLIQRPSRIYAAASLAGDQVHNVRVGGYVVEVLQGQMRL